MKQRVLLAFVTTVVIALLTAWTDGKTERLPTAQAACPPVQNTPNFTIVYGNVHINGSPAPVGALVEALSPRGTVVGCALTLDGGVLPATYIYGEDASVSPSIPGMHKDETVIFRVNGVPASVTPALVWSNDRTPHQVALSASGDPGTDTPTPTITPTHTPTPTWTPTVTPTPNSPVAVRSLYLPEIHSAAPVQKRVAPPTGVVEWRLYLPALGQ